MSTLIATYLVMPTVLVLGTANEAPAGSIGLGAVAAGGFKKTFKNNDVVTATDFHAEFGGNLVRTASSANFPDQTFNPPVHSFDVNLTTNISPNNKMILNYVADGSVHGAPDSHFTPDAIRTVSISTTQQINFTSLLAGFVTFSNTDFNQPLILTGVEVRVDNTGDPFAIGGFTPNGALVPGIPSSFTLAPGETTAFNFTSTVPFAAVSMSDLAALSSAPDDTYFEQLATITGIPEPSAFTLFGIGTLGVLGYAWRGKRSLS
jgi:hypothetical protein